MQKVLFLLYHGTGHLNASLTLAKTLSSRFDVTLAIFEFFKDDVVRQGLKVYSLRTVPFALGFEPWVNARQGKTNLSLNVIKDRWSDRLCDERERELALLVSNENPDLILIDSWQSTDLVALFPAIKGKGIKVGFLQTMLSTRLHKNVPPLNALSIPGDKESVNSHVKSFLRNRSIARIKNFVRYLGMDNSTMFMRRVRRNKFPAPYLSAAPTLFAPAFDNIPELILAPREFEFPEFDPEPHQYFLGFQPGLSRHETGSKEINETISTARKNGRPLVLCSFGSAYGEDHDKVQQFLGNLLEVARNEEMTFIVACKDQRFLLSQRALPENVLILSQVPQLQVLQYSSVFITHGGLNSIKESIYANVPLLVYPISNDTDANGNASRVVFHKLGIGGDIGTDDADTIRKKIGRLVTETSFRRNLAAMRKSDEAYSPDHTLSWFETIPFTRF